VNVFEENLWMTVTASVAHSSAIWAGFSVKLG